MGEVSGARGPVERLKRLGRFLFGVREPVGRLPYIVTGLVLAAVKLGVELWLRGEPLLAADGLGRALLRLDDGWTHENWLLLVLWTLPFAWIGVSLTARRAVDAGLHPALALLFFLPLINLFVFALLATAPTEPRPAEAVEREEQELGEWGRAGLAIGVGAASSIALFVLGILLVAPAPGTGSRCGPRATGRCGPTTSSTASTSGCSGTSPRPPRQRWTAVEDSLSARVRKGGEIPDGIVTSCRSVRAGPPASHPITS